MNYTVWSKAKDLQTWALSLEARQKLPALVRKLIHATVDNPRLIQFPADEGTQRRGWDGVLEVETGNAWIPNGKSVWEMGTDQNPETKANGDYTKRTDNPGAIKTQETTFVFVTPRKWEGKTKWLTEKRAENKCLNVLVWDCDDLEQWLETAPAVDAWLARLLGKLPAGVRDLSSYWQNLAATSDPLMTREVFIAGRTEAEKNLREALAGPPNEIVVSALSLSELRDFASAVFNERDEETENASTARALVVETAEAWNQLSTSKNRLLLIPSDQLPLEKPMVAEAVKAGHHVITQRSYTVIRGSSGIRLPRADRWELQKTLEGAGFSEESANRFAREAGGCLSVLVRLASKFAGQAIPTWSKPHEAGVLLPLVLLGTWSDRNEEDRKIIERFTGEPYTKIQQVATRWIAQPDAPLRLVEGSYSFVSREDSWQLLSPHFTSDLLERFAEIAIETLGEDDPRFDMATGERYLAGVYKKLPKFSPQLREGILETVALLGTRGEHTPQGASEGSSWRAARIVERLLQQASSKRWFSLAHALPLLAEAAPDEFLTALETDLQKPSPPTTTLFEKDADGLFSSSPHTNLMWALELLAWDTTHLSRVVLSLAILIKLDTGGRMNPRPAGVMHDIFRFWYPQTSATIDERLQVFDLLAKHEPDIAWTLLLGLLPEGHDSAMQTYRPRWRGYDASQTKQITDADIRRQVEWAAARLVKLAQTNPAKWLLLLEQFAKLPPVARDATLKWLREIDVKLFPEKARIEAWEQIRELVQKHRFFHNAWWVLPKVTVDELSRVEQILSPTDPVIRSKWMFDSRAFEAFGNIDTPFEERERLQTEAQSRAVQEIFNQIGLAGVFELVSGLQFQTPVKVGELLEKSGLLPDWRKLLPDKLISSQENERLVALGYASARQAKEGNAWIEGIPLEEWTPEAVGEFALALSCKRQTWQMLRRRKADAEAHYWRRAHPWLRILDDDELEEAIGALLQNGRPMVAADLLSSAIQFHKKPSWKIVADTVDLASSLSGDSSGARFNTMSVWELCELMKYLQNDPTADQERLVRLEWRLLPLARHDHFEPKILHSELAQNPGFFVEVLAAIFRQKNQPKDEQEQSNPTKQALAQAAFHLLESWTGIPGKKPDGTIDSTVLNNWVAEARKQCAANGRIEVCDSKIGEQLSYAPSDGDGSWPCLAVREVFEIIKTDDILSGFEIGVSNQRGVTSRGMKDGGEQERELVKKYGTFAEKCKVSWPRTALALRRIAENYERQAKWNDERAEARD